MRYVTRRLPFVMCLASCALLFLLLLISIQSSNVRAQVAVYSKVKMSSTQLLKGESFTLTLQIRNESSQIQNFSGSVTVKRAATADVFKYSYSSGSVESVSDSQKITYTWNGTLGGGATTTFTLSSLAGQEVGRFADAILVDAYGVYDIDLIIAETLPEILATSKLVPAQTVIITGTNLLGGEEEVHRVYMRMPFLPTNFFFVKKEDTHLWSNERIEFTLPSQGLTEGGTYRLYVQRGDVFSNDLIVQVSSDWTAKVKAPTEIVSGESVTYTVTLTNNYDAKRIGAVRLEIDATPFISNSLAVTYTAGETRQSTDQSKYLIIWGADLQPNQSATLTLTARVREVTTDTIFSDVVQWTLPGLVSSKADLTVRAEKQVLTPVVESKLYLPLVVR